MKLRILFLLLLAATSMSAQKYHQRYDTNRDGTVSIADVTALVNYILGRETDDDIQDNHEYVDLALPSGTLWATCNIGAEDPEGYGDYFAWGETVGYNSGKTEFSDNTYKWMDNSYEEAVITKYCTTDDDWGIYDGKTELEMADDAAYVKWGSKWCMPTFEQFEELINSNYTITSWTTRNGIVGRKITSKINGNSIFLPAAGYRADGSLTLGGNTGYYMSRRLYKSGSIWNYHGVSSLTFGSGFIRTDGTRRSVGQSVRPVRNLMPTKHEYVNLGLPSGTFWATCNIGAEKPEDYGDYFSWGETEEYDDGKTAFSWTNYKYCDGTQTTMSKYNTNDNKKELELSDDVAYMKWRSNWRMPNKDQMEELINSNYTTAEWTTQNSVYGCKITSKRNGKSIFLPASGYFNDTYSLTSVGSRGDYWLRTLNSYSSNSACTLVFYLSNGFYINTGGSYRYIGLNVRPVFMPQ